MKRAVLILWIAAITLTGCSRIIQIHLVNNTDADVTVLADGKTLPLSTQKDALFNYPHHAQFQLSAKSCDYSYEIERDFLLRIPQHYFVITARIEKDFSISILSAPGRGAVPLSAMTPVAGLVLHPSHQSCTPQGKE